MLKGRYKADNKEYSITIDVKETKKGYIFNLVENASRYIPAHMEMLFANSDKAVVKKEKGSHAMYVWSDDDFTIYPFRTGMPFYFKRIA